MARRAFPLAAIALAGALVGLPALGAETAPGMAVAPAPNAAVVCVNSGNQYRVGEYACIAACHGERRLARCDAMAEHASWTFVSNVCPSALLPRPLREATGKPIAAAMTPIPLPVEHLMSEMSPESWMRLVDAGKAVTRPQ
jgi:hypothetical protein